MSLFWTVAAYGSIIMGVLLMGITAAGLDVRSGRTGRKFRHYTLPIFLLLWGGLIFLTSGFAFAQQSIAPHDVITSIYWSDADSGRINGNIKFRLNSVDAPETGGVDAAIGGAECELERERGFEAKAWAVDYTRDAELSIARNYGADRYDRLIIELEADGQDVGRAGIDAGHLKPWPHEGTRALADKPEWCDAE